MAEDVGGDQLVIIRIDGMHCHKCETAIQRSLTRLPGVHEVEVDFNSGQASVLYDHGRLPRRRVHAAAALDQLMMEC
jgi:copper chaperone CopZ